MATNPPINVGVAALVYDYLKSTAGTLAETFKQKVNPVIIKELINKIDNL